MNACRFLSIAVAGLLTFAPTASPAAAPADTGAPQAHIVSPVDGLLYAPDGKEFFGFYCSSDTSFVVSCEGSQPLGSQIDTSTSGPHTLSVTATDFEGRQSTTTATYIVFDNKPPTAEIRVPADGATYSLGEQLTYDYSCTDDPGGVGVAGCIGDFPATAPVRTTHLGTFSFSVLTADQNANFGHKTVTYTVVDRSPPAITLLTPDVGAVFTIGQPVWVDFFCEDQPGGSGLSGCKGDLPRGSLLDTSTLGPGSFTVHAFDRAGNAATVTHVYSVIYDFAGFESPAAAYPETASAKGGEAIALKFSLNGDKGMDIFAPGSPVWAPCGSSDTTPAAGTLSYKPSPDRYTYLAATAKSWNGTCRDFVATLRDGTIHRARFTFGR